MLADLETESVASYMARSAELRSKGIAVAVVDKQKFETAEVCMCVCSCVV